MSSSRSERRSRSEWHRKRRYATKRAARPDVVVARLAADQWGVLSHEELLACGLSRDEVKSRRRRGLLHRLHHGVYAVGHPAVSLEGRFLAAVKACGDGAVLSHLAGAVLLGFIDDDGCEPEVTVAGSSHGRHPGIRTHRSSRLEPRDSMIFRGIPVTIATRTLIDLAAVVDYRTLRRAVRRALSMKRVTVGLLANELARLRPRRGAAKMARVLAAGDAPTRSVLEDVVLELISRGGLSMPDVNVPLWIAGRKVIPDFRWPDQHLVVEADGRTWHDNKVAREDDAERQALLEAAGERVVRITWEQAIARGPQTLARLRRAGAPALGSSGA